MDKITCLNDVRLIQENVSWDRGDGTIFKEAYRGQGKDCYSLTPGLFRKFHSVAEYKIIEEKLFSSFMQETSKGLIKVQNDLNKEIYPNSQIWFSLFQSQHLGLITRLLDWTINWKFALLCAVEDKKHYNDDGQFWVFKCASEHFITDMIDSEIIKLSPFETKRLIMINYPSYADENFQEYDGENKRIRQRGFFTIQPLEQAIIPLDKQENVIKDLNKYIIDKDSKKKIKNELAKEFDGITIDWAGYKNNKTVKKLITKINKTHS